ncbi:APC family permease [Gardnerella piotii]|uniref:APC family permease n=1 Tax=Gardnerella piotii TaxID=2792977 RepID=UPI003970C315
MQIWRKKSVEQTIAETMDGDRHLKRTLNAWDLAVMGVAVAVGAGIFSVGAQAAAFHAGPAVIISFIIAGIVCGTAAMCYAEFASMIPVAGSAYTFTYTTVGELVAWIIGWDMILEMLMAGSVIAKYWGVYLNDLMHLFGLNVSTSVNIGGFTFDLAPVVIVAFFTIMLVVGTKLSARFDGALTILKIGIVLFVVVVGFFYIKASNFTPFVPPATDVANVKGIHVSGTMSQPLWQWVTGMQPAVYGVTGILSGAALVFFAFIGFDVVATTAEETKDPHKNIPRGIGLGLLIVTVLYILVAVVTTGMVSYKDLAKQEAPSLSTSFELVGATWAAKIISLGIVIGLTTVVMVLLLGLTRIVFAVSRDGLLPRSFSKVSKRGIPARIQIVSGVVVAIIASTLDIGILSDMVNIGTLSAFLLVSAGVPIMRMRRPDLHRSFMVPWNPVLPIFAALSTFWLMLNLSVLTWIRFAIWLAIGFIVYFGYSYRNSLLGRQLRKAKKLGVPVETLFAQDAAAAEKVAEGESEDQARAEAAQEVAQEVAVGSAQEDAQ